MLFYGDKAVETNILLLLSTSTDTNRRFIKQLSNKLNLIFAIISWVSKDLKIFDQNLFGTVWIRFRVVNLCKSVEVFRFELV